MRKKIASFFFTVLIPWIASAQFQDFFRNSYVSVGVNPTYYLYDGGSSIGGGLDLSYGKWLLTSVGLRGTISGQYLSHGSQNDLYTYFHGELLWDPITSLRGRNLSDFWRTYLLLGLGVVRTSSSDADFVGVFGLGVDRRVGLNWRLFGEVGGLIQPSSFDNNDNTSYLLSLTLGVERDIQLNPTRSRTRSETKQFGNDWFFQVESGINFVRYSDEEPISKRLPNIRPIVEVGIGKRINTAWSVRLHLSGLYARYRSADDIQFGEPVYSNHMFSYVHAHGDLMFDILGWYRQSFTNFTARPYLGMGLIVLSDGDYDYLLGANVGLQTVYRFESRRSELFLDFRYLLTPPRLIDTEIEQQRFSVGLATATIGFSYNLSSRNI